MKTIHNVDLARAKTAMEQFNIVPSGNLSEGQRNSLLEKSNKLSDEVLKIIPVIYNNGFVSGIAYSKAKLPTVYKVLNEWFWKHPEYPIGTDLLEFLLDPNDRSNLADSFHILLYRKEALAYLGWLKRLSA